MIGTIKDFRRSCNQRFTSFGRFMHRNSDGIKCGPQRDLKSFSPLRPAAEHAEKGKNIVLFFSAHSAVGLRELCGKSFPPKEPTTQPVATCLACRHCQKPNQQSKQDQAAEERKRRVQRMELEIRVARQTISGRKHKDLLRVLRMRTDVPLLFSHHFGRSPPVFCEAVLNHCHA